LEGGGGGIEIGAAGAGDGPPENTLKVCKAVIELEVDAGESFVIVALLSLRTKGLTDRLWTPLEKMKMSEM